jgi:hypothetical protein
MDGFSIPAGAADQPLMPRKRRPSQQDGDATVPAGNESIVDAEGSFCRQAIAKRTALILMDGIPIDTWKQIGEKIFALSESTSWWIGDWIIYGKDKYPDRYRRAIEETSLDYQTLRNYAWVAGRFSLSRRRDTLSFQHHVEVASLDGVQQEVWLDRAERFGWSRNELRSRLRAWLQSDRPPIKSAIVMELNVSQERRDRWAAAAEISGANIVHWMENVLDQAAALCIDEEPGEGPADVRAP